MIRCQVVLSICLSIAMIASSVQLGFINPQTTMITGDLASFGGLTPYATQSAGNVYVNPASLGGMSFSQFVVSSFQLSNQLNYHHGSVVYPIDEWVFGLSYGSNVTDGFIETELVGDIVYDTGIFASGFNVLQVSLGHKLGLKGMFFIDKLYMGAGINMVTQVIGASNRSPSYGLSVGAITTSYIKNNWVDRIDMGLSIVDAVSTGLPTWTYDTSVGESSAQDAERQLFFGGRLFFMDNKTILHGAGYMQGFIVQDYMTGIEYQWSKQLHVRGSVLVDAYNLGLSIILGRVAGFGTTVYDMSVDYNYRMYPYPLADAPSNTISLQFLGKDMDQRPVILMPKKSFVTVSSTVSLKGDANSNSQVYIYNNNQLQQKITANKHGKWHMPNFLLYPGYNSITVRSQADDNDLSNPSTPLVVHYDKTPPEIDFSVHVMDGQLSVVAQSNEPLASAALMVEGTRHSFKSFGGNRYSATIDLPALIESGPVPSAMVTFNVYAEDTVGNKLVPVVIPVFVESLFPLDKTIVTSDTITAIGYGSPFVEKITVNNTLVMLDRNHAFSTPVLLDYGKGLVTYDIKMKNGQVLHYYARVMAIKTFEDIPASASYRRNIEFLATMGYIDGKEDGRFHPNEEMTRRDITLAIASMLDLESEYLTDDPFLDVPVSDRDAGLFLAAVDAGVLVAFSDGTFRPNAVVSVEDAFRMLNNSGVIDSDDIVVGDEPVTRLQFATFLTQVPQFEQRIQYLMDWDSGYDVPTN